MKVGDRVKMVYMPDDPSPIPAGTTGTITRVNPVHMGPRSFTQYSVDWDNGRHLFCIVPPDQLQVIASKAAEEPVA